MKGASQYQKINNLDETAFNNDIDNLSQDSSSRNHTFQSDRVGRENRGQLPQKPITPKMRLVDMMKNKFKSAIQDKDQNEVDSHDIKIEVKTDNTADYDNMRFIKHPTFLIEDKIDSPPTNGNQTKKVTVEAFEVEDGIPPMEPDQDCLKYQKPIPYDWFTQTYADDEAIQPLFNYKLEDEFIDSFWASPSGDKLLTINTHLDQSTDNEESYKAETELKLYDFQGQNLVCLGQIDSQVLGRNKYKKITFKKIGLQESITQESSKSSKSLVSLSNDEKLIVIFDKSTDQLYWCNLPNGLSDIFDESFDLESKLLNQVLATPSVLGQMSQILINHQSKLELLYESSEASELLTSPTYLCVSQYPIDYLNEAEDGNQQWYDSNNGDTLAEEDRVIQTEYGEELGIPKWHVRNKRRIYKLHFGHVAYTKSDYYSEDSQNETFIKFIDATTGNEFESFKEHLNSAQQTFGICSGGTPSQPLVAILMGNYVSKASEQDLYIFEFTGGDYQFLSKTRIKPDPCFKNHKMRMLKFVGDNYIYFVVGDKAPKKEIKEEDKYIRLYSLKESQVISDINLDNNCDRKIADQVPFSTLLVLGHTQTFFNIHPAEIVQKTVFKQDEFDEQQVIKIDRGMISITGQNEADIRKVLYRCLQYRFSGQVEIDECENIPETEFVDYLADQNLHLASYKLDLSRKQVEGEEGPKTGTQDNDLDKLNEVAIISPSNNFLIFIQGFQYLCTRLYFDPIYPEIILNRLFFVNVKSNLKPEVFCLTLDLKDKRLVSKHHFIIENVGLNAEKGEKFRSFFVDREGSDVMAEMLDEERNYYLTILSFNEMEGFKIVEPKVVYYGQILEEEKSKTDDQIFKTLKFMKNDQLYRKYRALIDGCHSTEINLSHYYCKDYLYQMFYYFSTESIAYQMTGQNTHSFLKWILVQDQDVIYFMNQRTGYVDTAIKMDSKIFEIYIDRVTHIDLYAKTKNGIFKINVMLDKRGYIPEGILIQPNMMSIYEVKTQTVKYYENLEKSDEREILTKLKLRSVFSLERDGSEDIEEKILLKRLSQLSENKSLLEIFDYSLLTRKDTITAIQRLKKACKEVYRSIGRKMDIATKNDLPLLALTTALKQETESSLYRLVPEQTSLESVIDEDEAHFTELIDIIYHQIIQFDTTGLIYSDIIERNLTKIKKRGMDLKPFLSSQIANHQVSYDYYNEYEMIPDAQKILVSNDDHLICVLKNYYENVVEKFKNPKGIKRILAKIEEKKAQANPECAEVIKQEKEKEKEEQMNQMQYWIVNLKNSLNSENSLEFLKTIMACAEQDISILELDIIQAITKYKWKTYTRRYFARQLVWILIFIISFFVDLHFWVEDKKNPDRETAFIVTRVICSCILLYFLSIEIRQVILLHSFKDYLEEFWSRNEIILYPTYIAYVAIAFSHPEWTYAIKSLQFVLVFSSFIKLCFFIRIFEQLSFLVQMLIQVHRDIGYFLLFFGFVIGAFTAVIGIIVNEPSDTYEGVHGIAFYLLAIKTSIGDPDPDTLFKNSQFKILAWLLWFVILIVGNIVFMNFVIAVVGSSYENCMEKMVAQSYMAHLDMIIEREIFMSEKERQNPIYFPNYLIVVKRVDEENNNNDGQEWQGMIKELKKQAEATRLKVSKEFSKVMTESQHNFALQLQAHRDEAQAHREEVNSRIAAIEEVAKETNARVTETQSKIDEILRMLQQKA